MEKHEVIAIVTTTSQAHFGVEAETEKAANAAIVAMVADGRISVLGEGTVINIQYPDEVDFSQLDPEGAEIEVLEAAEDTEAGAGVIAREVAVTPEGVEFVIEVTEPDGEEDGASK